MTETNQRVLRAMQSGLPKAKRTIFWLLKLILPISLAVRLLQYSGLLDHVSLFLNPVFQVVGLPGASSIAFVCSVFLPTYAPVAIISTMGLSIREMTILAIMCLISHNTLVETAIQKRTGSSYLFIMCLRIGMSFLAAFILNVLLPRYMGEAAQVALHQATAVTFGEVLLAWAKGAVELCLKMSLIITALMMIQRLLEEFRIMDTLSQICAPMMRFMGLSRECSFLWFIANIVGLTYGSAILIEQVGEGKLTRHDARMLNNHLAISHSLVEDTLVFVAIGVPVLWITIPRILLAIAAVWVIRGISKVIR
ncbi:MAG: nucleoside recognition protein [Bacteroidales bacterium]|nr:nucleoside recognition protein [Bacteroidales bacterium]